MKTFLLLSFLVLIGCGANHPMTTSDPPELVISISSDGGYLFATFNGYDEEFITGGSLTVVVNNAKGMHQREFNNIDILEGNKFNTAINATILNIAVGENIIFGKYSNGHTTYRSDPLHIMKSAQGHIYRQSFLNPVF